ncbi:MAG: PIN domain-containing protein [Methylococcaceae bacterium]|nr:PIN domain-containing protein [Methylococcaceae bacterium]
MVKAILLDTDIVINVLRKKAETIDTLLNLKQQKYRIYVCPVVIAEIYAGAFAKEYEQIATFFSYCQCLTIDESIGKIAGLYANQYRKAYNKISLEDYLIAACAKKYQLSLWTNNKKHYPMQDIQLFETYE